MHIERKSPAGGILGGPGAMFSGKSPGLSYTVALHAHALGSSSEKVTAVPNDDGVPGSLCMIMCVCMYHVIVRCMHVCVQVETFGHFPAGTDSALAKAQTDSYG